MHDLNRNTALVVTSKPQRTSALFAAFAASLTGERVSVREIADALGDRGLGVMLAIFAIPNVFPSTVPFGNVLTGIPVILLAIQLMLGFERLIIPGFIARRTIDAAWIKRASPGVVTLFGFVERLLRPRLAFMTTPRAERGVGVLCFVLSVLTTLPVPFGHQIPAFSIILIGLGLIEGDGLAILIGAGLGLAGLATLILLVIGLVHGAHHLLHIHSLRHWLKRH